MRGSRLCGVARNAGALVSSPGRAEGLRSRDKGRRKLTKLGAERSPGMAVGRDAFKKLDL